MRFSKTGNITFCCDSSGDRRYIHRVAEVVCARYDGSGLRWQLPDSEQMWKLSLGGRAGVLGVTLDGRTCCVKLFYDRRLRTRIRVWLGFAKGRRAYANGLRLERVGVSCPKMWGYAERRPVGPVILVTELATRGSRLDLWAAEHPPGREAATALARFIRDMHDRGVFHIDLSARNILICPAEDRFEFLLLDYEDARFVRRVGRRTRLKNLHHLHERMAASIPLRTRLRFLRQYAGPDYRRYRDTLRRMLARSKRYRRLQQTLATKTDSVRSSSGQSL